MSNHVCKPANLLNEYFGKKMGGYVLWNYTCFPFDDDMALRQAERVVARHKEVGDTVFSELDAEIETEMDNL